MTLIAEVRQKYRKRILYQVGLALRLLADAPEDPSPTMTGLPTVGAAGPLYGKLPPMDRCEYFGCGSIEDVLELRRRYAFPADSSERTDIRWELAQGPAYRDEAAHRRLARLTGAYRNR